MTLVVIGSSPITHQINYKLEKYKIKQLYGNFLVNISEYTWILKKISNKNLDFFYIKNSMLPNFLKNKFKYWSLYIKFFLKIQPTLLNQATVTTNNFIFININNKKKQIFIVLKKNNFKKTQITLSAGAFLKQISSAINKKSSRASIFFLKKLILKLNSFPNFLKIFKFNGLKLNTNSIILKLQIELQNIQYILVNPSISFNYIKKKKYAAIKKNLKKRLLK